MQTYEWVSRSIFFTTFRCLFPSKLIICQLIVVVYIAYKVKVVFQMTEKITDQKIIDETTSMYDNLEDFGLLSYEVRVFYAMLKARAQLDQLTMGLLNYPALSQVPFRVTSFVTNTFDVIDSEKVLLKISNPINPSEYFAAI